MRPESIKKFEVLYFGALAFGILQVFAGWRQAMSKMTPGAAVFSAIFMFSLMAVLGYLVAHRHSIIGKWVIVIFVVCGIPVFLKTVSQGAEIGYAWISVIQLVMQLIACCLLFTSSAREWLAESN